MNYTTIGEFGRNACVSITEILGSEYDAVYKEVLKNNNVYLHSIMINKRGSNAAPAIYIDELYKAYKAGRAYGEVIYEILSIYKRSYREVTLDMDFFTRFASVKDRILYKLINMESNVKLLSEIPHVKWNDLAIVFYYMMDDCMGLGQASILIRNSHMSTWDINCTDLYEAAAVNMSKFKPEDVIPISRLIKEFAVERNNILLDATAIGITQGDPVVYNGRFPAMYVLSSKDKHFGAAVLLYSEKLKKLSGELNKNLIILPSSVHEVLLLPDDGLTEASFYKDMVREVNDTQLEPEEILSYNVYYYDRFKEKIAVFK